MTHSTLNNQVSLNDDQLADAVQDSVELRETSGTSASAKTNRQAGRGRRHPE
ncbi:hypothetical protein ACWCXK_28720 [Streptomyces sp. NPDC001739]|uniref:hypothetical protein n=1 Tax=Streptomyces sp. NPDC001657 TaxID=3154522 RepID=UPI003325BFC0